MTTHEAFMREALREAAADAGEVPVGAVIVYGGEIVARAHNERERAPGKNDASVGILQCRDAGCQAVSDGGGGAAPDVFAGGLFAHAEMLAMARARRALHARDLRGCALYVTLEPCPMCAGAILLSRIDRCVFGAFDPRQGCCGSVYLLPGDPALNGKTPCFGGVLEDECRAALEGFFGELRKK